MAHADYGYIHNLHDASEAWNALMASADKTPVDLLASQVHKLRVSTLRVFNRVITMPIERLSGEEVQEIQKIGVFIDHINRSLRPSSSGAWKMVFGTPSRQKELQNTDIFENLEAVGRASNGTLDAIFEKYQEVNVRAQQESEFGQYYYATNDPAALEGAGRRCLEDASRQVDPDSFRFISAWGVRLLEKSSELYQSQGNHDKASDVRIALGNFPIAERVAIGKFREDLETGSAAVYNPLVQRNMVLGVGYTDQDGPFVRRGGINIRRIDLEGQPCVELNAKLLRRASDRVRERLTLLRDPAVQAKLIAANACVAIEVREEPYLYYGYENNRFTRHNGMQLGTALVVEFPGIGKIEIGNSPDMASMHNKLRITLVDGATKEDLQKICGLCGLTFLMTEATASDQKRMAFHSVLHQMYPALSTRLELDPNFDLHGCPMGVLVERIRAEPSGEKILKDINDYMPNVSKYTIYPGCEGFRIDGLSERLEAEGCRGFMMGVRDKAPAKDVAKTAAAMISSGIISSQQRFDQGIHQGGASSADDCRNDAADSVYCRNMTEKALKGFDVGGGAVMHREIEFIPLASNVQILLSTDVAQQQHYCHFEDSYGCRNPNSVEYGHRYKSRPSLLEQTKANQLNWEESNEVMFKERIESGFIRGVTIQDHARRRLLEYLERNHPGFFPAHIRSDEDKLRYISDNIPLVKQAVEPRTDPNILLPVLKKNYPSFFPRPGMSDAEQLHHIEQNEELAHNCAMPKLLPPPLNNYRIEEHWAIDIKKEIKAQLRALAPAADPRAVMTVNGMELDELIQEQNELTTGMFRNCHSQR